MPRALRSVSGAARAPDLSCLDSELTMGLVWVVKDNSTVNETQN